MTGNLPAFAIEPLKVSNQILSMSIEGSSGMDENYIRVESIQGQEAISQPFQLSVELRADDVVGRGGELKVLDASCIGLWAKVKVAQAEPEGAASGSADGSVSAGTNNEQQQRFFRGIISEFSLGAPGCYTLSLQSPLFILTLRNRYHIFSDCDIRSLLQMVLAQELVHPGFLLRFDFDESLTLTRTQDWLQAGETDMEFVQRILGKGGVYYYFVHEEKTLTLVFSNSTTKINTTSIPGHSSGPVPLRYTYMSVEKLGSQQNDIFSDLKYAVKMMPGHVRSLLTRTEAEWENNTVATYANYEKIYGQSGQTSYQHHRCYDYGTNETESETRLKKICQQIETEAGTLSGSVSSSLLSPGYTFTLLDPTWEEFGADGAPASYSKGRPQFDGRVFVVTQIQHKMSSTTPYSGSVQATSVNTDSDDYKQTLLTPFSMQNTQQGSVLATVLQHEKPSGWRYRSKKNFQPEDGQSSFEGESDRERGCLVRLATGQEHWVVLSRPSQTVPEVGAMVMVGRGSNESEQPELQQIMASHGSKVIQPPGRRSASWQANTNWGSSYSTSYGDGISIRYGHQSATDLPSAIRLVESAYDNSGMAGTLYGNTSYSKGGSWSVSLSDNEDKGVLGASISQGSSFNESHSDHSYGYSAVNLSENYSEVGKTASVSVVGEYTASPDLAAPSFIDGKVPKDLAQYSGQLSSGDSFNKSTVNSRSISASGIGLAAPNVSIAAVLPGSYSNSIIFGVNESHHKMIGATLNDSLMVGPSVSNSVNLSLQYSNSFTLGNSTSLDTRIGNVSSVSTVVGSNSSLSTRVSDSNSVGINVGNNVSSQLNIANNINTNLTLGNSTDTSLYIGNKQSTNAFIGASDDLSLNVAARKSTAVTVGTSDDTSVNVAAKNSTNVFVGATNETSINVAARNSTSISVGASNETSISVAARKSQSISVAASDDTNINIGAKTSMAVNISASTSIENNLSASMSMQNSISASMELVNSLSASAKIINQAGPEFKMVNGLTQAEIDSREKAKLRQTIVEIIGGLDIKM